MHIKNFLVLPGATYPALKVKGLLEPIPAVLGQRRVHLGQDASLSQVGMETNNRLNSGAVQCCQ